MQVRRHNLSNILLFAIIAICLYLIQRIATFEASTAPLSYAAFREERYPEYIIAFATLIAVSFWYFFTQYKSKAFKPHYPLIGLLTILGIISIVMIFIFPSRFVTDVPVYTYFNNEEGLRITVFDYYKTDCLIVVGIEQRIFYVLLTITALYAFYLTLWVLPRKIRYLRQLNVIMYILIAFAIVAIIFSYATEFNKYVSFFEILKSGDAPMTFEMIESFVSNRNSFGVVLMFASFSCLYLHHLNNRWWFLPMAFVFNLQILLIGSKTNMLICSLVFLVYFIAWLVFRFKKHLLSSLIIIGSITLVLGTLGILTLVHHFNNGFMDEFFISGEKLFRYYVIRAFSGSSYTGRNANYDKVVILLNSGNYWALGMGYGLFNYLFNGMENVSAVDNLFYWDKDIITKLYSEQIIASDSPHSSFYQLIGTGGIVTLVLYVLVILYLIFAMVRVFKKHKMTVILCASFLLSSIMHSFTEAPTLFFLSPVYIDSFLFTLFVAIPILSLYYHSKHPSENREFLANYEQKDAKLTSFDKSCLVSKSLYFFLTPVVVIMCAVAPLVWKLGSEHLALTIVVNSLAAIYIFLPIVFQLIFDRKTKFIDFLKNVLIPYFAEAIVFMGFVRLYALAFGGFTLTMSCLFMFVALLGHIALFSRSKYFFEKAGIITLLLDKVCNIVHEYEVKYIEVLDEKESLTLQEKFFSLFIPRRFKNHETTNN